MAMTIELNPDEDLHVVINGNAVALSLNALDAAYQGEQINDETLIWQHGLSNWMRLHDLLAALDQQSGPGPEPSPVDDDTYFVLVAEGEVKEMNLDLLADAYRLDVINDETLVWQPGDTEWVPLSFLLGPVEEHVSVAPSVRPGLNAAADVLSREAPSVPSSIWSNSAPTSADSFMPAALSVPAPPPAASPWYRRGLLALAAIGLLTVAHRNGVTQAAAQSLDQEASLSALEGRWGGAGLDTAHGLESWLSVTKERYGLAQLSETEPVPEPQAAQASAGTQAQREDSPATTPDASEESDDGQVGTVASLKAEPSGTVQQGSEGTTQEQSKDSGAENPAAAGFAASLSGKPKVAPAPVRARSKSPRPAPVRRKLPAGDPNDPMNGDL